MKEPIFNHQEKLPQSVPEIVNQFTSGTISEKDVIRYLRENKKDITEFCLQTFEAYREGDKTGLLHLATIIESSLADAESKTETGKPIINEQEALPQSVEEMVDQFTDHKLNEKDVIKYLRKNKDDITEFCFQTVEAYREGDKTGIFHLATIIESLPTISESKIEKEPTPRDISSEFLSMDPFEFEDFLQTLKNEPSLSITIDWVDWDAATRLKAFKENRYGWDQKRSATIRATEEQHEQALNAFASGVKWEKI